MIGTPAYDGVKLTYVQSLVSLMHRAPSNNIEVYPFFNHGSAIHQQRNIIVANFLRASSLTHLLFIDSDIAFSPEAIFKLISYDKEFSGVAYRAKGDTFKAFNVSSSNAEPCKTTGLIKVDGMGGGFMLFKRSAIEKMIKAYPNLKCLGFPTLNPEHAELNKFYYNLFDWSLNEKTNYILSEDFTFCHRWAKIGGEIFVDPDQELGHEGNKTFLGKLRDNIVDNKIITRRIVSKIS